MERYLIVAGDHDKFLFDESGSETYCYEQIKLFYFFNFINRQTEKNLPSNYAIKLATEECLTFVRRKYYSERNVYYLFTKLKIFFYLLS